MLVGDIARKHLRKVELVEAKSDPEALRDVERVSRDGFRAFIRIAWPQLETGEYLHNWHIDAIAEHLEAVTIGEIRRLIINQPPGTMKSLLTSVLWNAWVWTEDPSFRWIFASYTPKLSLRDAIKVRNLINSPWWRARWPRVEIPRQNTRAASDFSNSGGGWRFSTGTKGVTGRHADVQVADDPHQPQDVTNAGGMDAAALQSTLEWWTKAMPTRLRDPKTSRRVIVMQRLHERDLSGAMLETGDYEVVMLPMRFEPERRSRTYITNTTTGARELFFEDPRTTEGELLWNGRYPESEVKRLEKELQGEEAGQLQQRPIASSGGIFKEAGLKKCWHEIPPEAVVWIMSVDARFKDSATSGDRVAIGVWASTGIDHYLVDQVCERMSFSETVRAILKLSAKYPRVMGKLVENKANGPAIVNTLEKVVPGLILVEPLGGKTARAHAVSSLFDSGNVYLPADEKAHPWVPGYRKELGQFPKSRFDDQVDQTTQALAHLHAESHADYARAMEAVRAGA